MGSALAANEVRRAGIAVSAPCAALVLLFVLVGVSCWREVGRGLCWRVVTLL